MPKGVYIRKRKSARKPKAHTKHKQKQKQSQKQIVNISGGGGGGAPSIIQIPQYIPTQQMIPQQTTMPSQQNIMEQTNTLLSGFKGILDQGLSNFGMPQNQAQTIYNPTMSNVRLPPNPLPVPETYTAPVEIPERTLEVPKTEKKEVPEAVKKLSENKLSASSFLESALFRKKQMENQNEIKPLKPYVSKVESVIAEPIFNMPEKGLPEIQAETFLEVKRRVGRPVGSKNKPKSVASVAEAQETIEIIPRRPVARRKIQRIIPESSASESDFNPPTEARLVNPFYRAMYPSTESEEEQIAQKASSVNFV